MSNKKTDTKNIGALEAITFTMSSVALALSVYMFIDTSDADRIKEITTLYSLEDKVDQDVNIQEPKGQVSEEFLENFIMENPKLIVKSLGKMRFEQEQLKKQAATKKIETFNDALFNKKTDPVIGNLNGKHVLVEFIDNNCGYCKKLAPVLERLIEIDPEAKIIVKEFPIFDTNPSSHYSALVGTSIWLTEPSKYAEFHKLAINTPRLSNDAVDAFAEQVGMPISSIEDKMGRAEQIIKENRLLGTQLQVTGTPTIFIGGERLHGGLTAEQLKAKFL